MNSYDQVMSDPVLSSDVDDLAARKAVLFCPACDHRSPIDGDWIVRERDASVEYRCPDCGNQVTERGRDRSPRRLPA